MSDSDEGFAKSRDERIWNRSASASWTGTDATDTLHLCLTSSGTAALLHWLVINFTLGQAVTPLNAFLRPITIDGVNIANRIGIGTTTPGNILTVQQNSATDPIADAWTTRSSSRWKTNIQPLAAPLDKVQRLRGVSFDWKTNGKHDIGLIAEEAGEVIPEVVAYEEGGKNAKSVDDPRLVAVLIEAMKEQQDQIEGLKAEVQGLKGKFRLADQTAEVVQVSISNK